MNFHSTFMFEQKKNWHWNVQFWLANYPNREKTDEQTILVETPRVTTWTIKKKNNNIKKKNTEKNPH